MLNKELDGVFQMVMGKTPPHGQMEILACVRVSENNNQ
jgi:hypothetical protein